MEGYLRQVESRKWLYLTVLAGFCFGSENYIIGALVSRYGYQG
jgi:hypothetical protein